MDKIFESYIEAVVNEAVRMSGDQSATAKMIKRHGFNIVQDINGAKRKYPDFKEYLSDAGDVGEDVFAIWVDPNVGEILIAQLDPEGKIYDQVDGKSIDANKWLKKYVK